MALCSMLIPTCLHGTDHKQGIKSVSIQSLLWETIWETISAQVGVNNLLPMSMQSSLWRQEQQESVTPYQLQIEAVPSKQSWCSGQLAVPGAADDKHGAGRWSADTSTISAGSHLWLASQDFSFSRSVSMTLLRLPAVVLRYAPT